MAVSSATILYQVEEIDEVFGKGYAKANPELIYGLIQAEQTWDGAVEIRNAIRDFDMYIGKPILDLANATSNSGIVIANGLEELASILKDSVKKTHV